MLQVMRLARVCGKQSISVHNFSKCLSSVPRKENSHIESTYSNLLYKLPHIRVAGLLNRMKVYQTAVAATTASVSIILYQMSVIPSSTLYAVVYLGIATCVPFYTIGIFCNNLVGHIYLSDDMKTVKLAYINFWGRRKDTVIEVEDILPFSEIRGKPTDIYFKLERYSDSSALKISLKYGNISNMDLFVRTFGDV